MKKIFLTLITALITILSLSAQNTYNMVIEMNDGTKINIGPNDIKNMSFVDGNLTISGESIDDIKKEIAELKKEVNEQKSCECSNEIETLKKEIANLNTSEIIAMINVLQMQIKSLADEVASIKENGGNNDSQGGDNDGQGGGSQDQGGNSGNDDSTLDSRLVGIWYEQDGEYIHGFCFEADRTGWKGEWRIGSQEEHKARTWEVQGNRLLIYRDGDLSDDFIYSISADGTILSLTETQDGRPRGNYIKQ